MNIIREMVRSHQTTTDTSDGEMLNILCAYIGSGLYPNVEALELYIVDHLERDWRNDMDTPAGPEVNRA